MKNSSKKLVIVGLSAFAEIAYEYFTHDSNFNVTGFAANQEFINSPTWKKLPVIDIEKISSYYPPSEYYVFVAIVSKTNGLGKILSLLKAKGYKFATYISSKCLLNTTIGSNTSYLKTI